MHKCHLVSHVLPGRIETFRDDLLRKTSTCYILKTNFIEGGGALSRLSSSTASSYMTFKSRVFRAFI